MQPRPLGAPAVSKRKARMSAAGSRLFSLAIGLVIASSAYAETATDYRQRTCTVGNAGQILEAVSAIVSAADREAFLSNLRTIVSSSRGGDCGITSVSELCDLIFVANGSQLPEAIIGENAPDGPMPQTRASIAFLAKARIPLRGIVLHHADLIDDAELMAFLEAEIRDVVSQQGLDGAAVPICQCRPACDPASKR